VVVVPPPPSALLLAGAAASSVMARLGYVFSGEWCGGEAREGESVRGEFDSSACIPREMPVVFTSK
jgi:hypothetical protein